MSEAIAHPATAVAGLGAYVVRLTRASEGIAWEICRLRAHARGYHLEPQCYCYAGTTALRLLERLACQDDT